MKRIIRLAICVVLCAALLCANMVTADAASGFFSAVDMLLIDTHLEGYVDLGSGAPAQGACTDGKYAYFGFVSGGVCTLAKFDVNTWEYVSKEKIINMGHSNDMTYNSDKDYLVVANNAPYYDVITLIDPDTLAPVKDVQIKEDIYSIAYNAKRKCYVVGLSGTYDFAILDDDFKVKEKFEGVKTGYTRQGCDCDDDYIYFVQSGGSNILVVYDYDGNHITDIPMTSSDEVENIFHVGNTFYTSLFYYGNKLYRIGFNGASKIAYHVSYDPNGGEGEMKSTAVTYGESTKLAANTFTRDGYFFAGWRVQRTSDGKYIGYAGGASDYDWLDEADVYDYVLYDDEEPVSSTVRYGSVKLYAEWIADRYEVHYDSGDGAGEAYRLSAGHFEELTVPELDYTQEGFILDGYTAQRECDGRVYGYRSGSKKPEWLEPADAHELYRFRAGDTYSAMTPEGAVNMTAQYQYAYTFGEDGSTLVEYVGVDEKVNIPSNDGELKTLAEGAIRDNENMKDLYIPAGVNAMQKQSISNCPKLRNIYFEGELPDEIDGECYVGKDSPVVYEIRGGQPFCIGFLTGQSGVSLLRLHADSLKKTYAERFEKSE
ncbi:MAG: InlB B-repeat-containing protein [Ruminococcus sp.]|nr:InlB B-repeat-containing protein [Ruminococcus sp.]